MQHLLFAFTGMGLLFAGLGIPMILRRVPPNRLYGLRVPATFADERVWYEANAKSGWDLVILGVALAVLAPLLWTLGWDEAVYSLVWTVAALAGALTMSFVGIRRANRLLKEIRDGRDSRK